MDCIFCNIVAGQIPAKKVHEDEQCLAFVDIEPAAPTHVLVIPKKHISSLAELGEADIALAGHLLVVIKTIADQLDLTEAGYRVVNNIGELGGQTVHHLHFHLLGGRALTWPPG